MDKFSTKIFLVTFVFGIEAAIVTFLFTWSLVIFIKTIKLTYKNRNWTVKRTTLPLVPPPFSLDNTSRNARAIKSDLIPFLQNIRYNYANPLECEKETDTITSFPLVRDHLDAYLYYIYHKKYSVTLAKPSFQIIFNPVPGIKNRVSVELLVLKKFKQILQKYLINFSIV